MYVYIIRGAGMKAWPMVSCALAAALFGASTPAAKVLVDQVGPVTLAGLFYLGAAVAMVPWVRGQRRTRPDRKNLLRLGGAVVLGGVLGPVLLLWGLSRAPAGSVALWLSLETVATAVLAWAMFREHMDRRTWLAAALTAIASTLVAAPDGFAAGPAAVLVALACIAWGVDNNFTAVIDGFTPAQTTFFKGAAAGTFNLGLGLWLEGGQLAVPVIAGALAIGALSYGVSLVLYTAGAQRLGATRSQMIFATAPFFGLGLAWTAGGEGASSAQVGAAAIMAATLWLIYKERHSHVHTHAPTTHTHGHRHDDGHHHHTHLDLPAGTWHSHEHTHDWLTHDHLHHPDLHHRHVHPQEA